MHRRVLAFTATTALLLTISAPLYTPALAERLEEPDFAHHASDIQADDRVIYGKLENGLRYAVMRNATPSGVAAVRMRIDTGSLNETDAQQGLAHFLEHMAFNGSTNVPEGEMVKRLERYGLAFGADTNASTGFDQTTYKLNLPTVADEVLDEAFFLMRETASNLLLDANAIERERGVIASEKLARDSLQFRAFVDRLRFFTDGSGLTERLPIGIDETIATMPREEFVSYYRGYYRPENTFIAVIGDLDPADAIARIERYFGDWQGGGEALPQAQRNPADIIPGKVGIYIDDGLMTTLTLATMRPYTERPDNSANRRERLLRGLGARMLNERMRRKVNEGSAAYLAGGANWYPVEDTVEGMTLSLRTTPEDWSAALADGEQDLRRALQFGFSQAELDEQIAQSRQARETAVERADTRKTYAGGFEFNYAKAIVDAFAQERVFNSPQTSLELFEEAVKGLTVAEVETAFRAAWEGVEEPKIYFSSSSAPEGGAEAILAALEETQQVAVSPPEKRKTPKFAYTDFGEPGEVTNVTYLENADAYLVKFANNVRLNFKQTDFDDGTIYLRARVGEGFLSMPEKSEGLRRLGLNVLSRSGVEAHTADELRAIFAGRRVGLNTRTRLNDDAFDLLGATGADDFSAQLELMAAKVAAPAFREEIAEQHVKRMQAWYPTHDSSVEAVANKYLPRLIRSGDTRFGYDDLDNFLAPTLEDVRAWMEPQFSEGLIEVTIVGDIDLETATREVARTFGALSERADSKAPVPGSTNIAFPEGSSTPHVFEHKGNEEQALVYVYWPAPDASDPADQFRMRLLRGLFRNRLTEVLREEMGATYSPGAANYSSTLFDGYGYMYARITSKPGQADEVRRAVFKVAEQMASEGFDQDAFERARKPLLEDLGSSLENNAYWMNVLRDAQTSGDGLAGHRVREATYREASVQEINGLAARVFNNANSVSAYILPVKTDEE
ncbi:M16 family metallopeptidase [Altererythrobacter lutimaris]|uniref:Insulinase family protein n=1 Tax=Altererythrobacter lutimaris TaxID=2743979 RepID=A0A850HFW8_9SPHN|nr:insulinase family protein [Altererythrobacter lutimaris]NVE96038.1 insulinase family protein [Altererythrobacter lutimaris]